MTGIATPPPLRRDHDTHSADTLAEVDDDLLVLIEDDDEEDTPPPADTARHGRHSASGGHRPDGLAQQRLQTGNPLLIPAPIASRQALPLDAQRSFRGWVLLALLGSLLMALALTVFLVYRLSDREIIYAPAAARLSENGIERLPTEWELRQQMTLLVQHLESHTPFDVGRTWDQVQAFFLPVLYQRMESRLQEIVKESASLWRHRICAPLGIELTPLDVQGKYTAIVYFDRIELIGEVSEERAVSGIMPWVAYTQVLLGQPTRENPLGLQISSYRTYERSTWVTTYGGNDLWTTLRGQGAQR